MEEFDIAETVRNEQEGDDLQKQRRVGGLARQCSFCVPFMVISPLLHFHSDPLLV
jgi:hypothetical protein